MNLLSRNMVLPEESNHSFCLNLIIMGKMRYTRPLAKLQNFLNPKLPKKLCSSSLLLTQVGVLCGPASTCALAAMTIVLRLFTCLSPPQSILPHLQCSSWHTVSAQKKACWHELRNSKRGPQ